MVSHWTCLTWKDDDSFYSWDTDIQRIGSVVITLTIWTQCHNGVPLNSFCCSRFQSVGDSVLPGPQNDFFLFLPAPHPNSPLSLCHLKFWSLTSLYSDSVVQLDMFLELGEYYGTFFHFGDNIWIQTGVSWPQLSLLISRFCRPDPVKVQACSVMSNSLWPCGL